MSDASRPIRRALISVYDKAGLVPFARELAKRGVALHLTVDGDGHKGGRERFTDLAFTHQRLPRLPELTCAVYLRESAEEPRIGQLADALAETLRPAIAAPSAIPPDVEEPATQLHAEH